MKQLSIIIPIYNVEEYIFSCLSSVYRQGLDDDIFEVILVNDGTPDKSMESIAPIIESHQNIHIIEQENQGLSMARNNGMKVASGEYILFVDSDDLLIDNCLSMLLEKAFSTKADLVVADFQRISFDNSTTNTIINKKEFRAEEISNTKLILDYLEPKECCVWRTLYRRLFLNDNKLCFIPNICYEDVPFTHECYLKAKSCIKAHWPIYLYRVNRFGAITESFSKKKAMDYCTIIAKLWELKHSNEVTPNILKKLENNIFVYFSLLFYYLSSGIRSRGERKEVIDYLKKVVPDLSFHNGFRQRAISIIYKSSPMLLIWVRYSYGKYFEGVLLPFLRRSFSHKNANNKTNI